MADIQTDGKELIRTVTCIVADMHPELLRKAMRSGLRRVANTIRIRAISVFESAVPGLKGRLSKAVNAKVHRDLNGFRVRVLRSGQNAMLKNRRGLEKPLPLFFEHGGNMDGSPRQTRGRYGRPVRQTGTIAGAHSLEKVDAATTDGEIDDMVVPAIESYAQKIINKYGL